MTFKHSRILAVLAVVMIAGVARADLQGMPADAFPIGLYSVPETDAHFEFVKSMGVDYVHTYGMGGALTQEAIGKSQVYLDLAQKHGLQVLVNIHTRKWVHKGGGLEEFKQFVRRFKDHPAVGMWYLYDEPDPHTTVEELQPFYQFLKQETPSIPVATALHWSENWKAYHVVTDVILNDFYPVKNQTFPEASLQHPTTFTEQAMELGPAVMPVLQCFNWGSLAKGAKTYNGIPVEEYRYPNEAELRYMIYGTLAQGTRGVFFWSYYHGVRYDRKWMVEEFKPAMQELRELATAAAPLADPTILDRARDNNVYMALWDRPQGKWLIMVNAWPLARDLNQWMQGSVESGRLVPVGSTRDADATLSKGQVKVHAEPWEAFVWKIEPAEAE